MISLGQASNYSLRRVFAHLFAAGTSRSSLKLRQALARRYGIRKNSELTLDLPVENIALYRTGRSALTACIQAIKPVPEIPKNSSKTQAKTSSEPFPVILAGLTCIAVVRAIRAAGCEPVFCDITSDRLEFDYEKLQQILADLSQKSQNKHKPIDKNDKVCYNGIIIVQNTLGLSWDVSKIKRLAKQYHFAILEDLAHSAGRYYPDGSEVGTAGQAVALSFGKGKAIDTICGGAAVIRTETICPNLAQPTQKPRAGARWRDRWYPLLASLCRASWRCGLGRLLMAAFIKLHWVERSADVPLSLSVRLTHWQAALALRQLAHLPTSPLREFQLVSQRTELLAELYQNGYNFSEIWYDTPVSPARYATEADFPAQTCPRVVEISQQIINLPSWYPPKKLARARQIIAAHQKKAAPSRNSTPNSASVCCSETDDSMAALSETWSKIQQCFPEANLFQSPAWGEVQRRCGKRVITKHFSDQAWCQMVVCNARRARYLEISCGPLLDWDDESVVRHMFATIRQVAKQEKCAFVRMRPQLLASESDKLAGLKLRRAPMHLAAEHTVMVDLTRSEEEILASFRRQTRYEVRRAAKLGIAVTADNSETTFREFQQAQAITAARQHFIPPQLATLLAEREALGQRAQIYVARTAKQDSTDSASSAEDAPAPNQPIAYGLILIDDNEADYYEAASTDLHHHLPGAYALQWQVIRDLKKQGIPRYNLWGIAPSGQPHHRYAGVTTFKTGFGKVVEFVPAQDLVINKFRYALDWAFEKLRKKRRHL